MTPDVNVLVAAFRPHHRNHRVARAWLNGALRECATGTDSLRLLPVVLAGFLRIVTNPRIMAEPEPTETAVAFVDALVAEPGVEVTGGWAWGGLRDRILALGLQGNAIPDAWIAAQAEALMERLVTLDRDFKRLLPSRSLILLTPED